MMRFIFFILLAITLSCTSKKSQDKEEIEEKQRVTITHTPSQMQLVGEAQQIASQWTAYRDFITSLENLDHTIATSEILIDHISDMKTSIPDSFQEQGIISRMKVLETRVNSYHSLLSHNQIETREQQQRFNDLVLSLDQLKIQMMDKISATKQEENLLKNLEENELNLDEPSDSLSQ